MILSETSGEILRLSLVYSNGAKEKTLLERMLAEKPITPSEQRFLSEMLIENGNTEYQIKLHTRPH